MRKACVATFAISVAIFAASGCTPRGPLVSAASPTPVATTSGFTASPVSTASPNSSPPEAPPPAPSPSSAPSPAGVNPGAWLRWRLMGVPRADFTATLLANGKVLLVGGMTTATADTATVDVFDPVTNSITPVASMKSTRNGHTATLLPNGRVLVVGGSAAPNGPALATAEVYDPTANAWSLVAPMSYGRVHHAAVLTVDSKVLVVGGTDAPTPVERYDPAANAWTSISIPANDPRPSGPTATTLPDGRVMSVGGANGGAHTVNADIWLYDPSNGQISVAHGYPQQGGTNWATATRLSDGKVLVAGGEDSTNPSGAVSTTFFYDPIADTAPSGPQMNVGHCHHTMTTLRNGLVLVAGGRCGAQDSINVCELYDAKTNRWWAAGELQDPRGYHVAVLLPDGRVLAAGGIYPGGTIAQTTELYAPA